MPPAGGEKSVEERLEKARLLTRINAEVLTMCKSVDKLLHAQHTSNLAHAVVCVQEIAREQFAVVIALKWVVLLVDMLESDTPDVRLAACNALAAISVAQEGRDAVRSCGGLRPLVMLLAEGSRSPIAAAAAAVLMNCSACDTCKVAIADCRGVPMLLGLIREAVSRCTAGSSSGGASGAGGGGSAGHGLGHGSGGGGGHHELKSPGDCRAAAYAAGALMNMGGVSSVQDMMVEAGAVSVFEGAIRVAAPGDVVATRANFVLSWLAVGTGSGLDLTDVMEPDLMAGPGPGAARAQEGRRISNQGIPGAAAGGSPAVRVSGAGLSPGNAGAPPQLPRGPLAASRQLLAPPGQKVAGIAPAGKAAVAAGS